MLITRTRSDEPVEGIDHGPAADGDGFVDGAVLDFGSGIPGFPQSRYYRLENLAPELQPFCVMRSVQELSLIHI